MTSSTEKQGLTPSMISRVAKAFVAMVQRTQTEHAEAIVAEIMQDPPKPPAEPPAAPTAPREKTSVELLLEQALREATVPDPTTKHIVYTEDQLAAVDLRLPRPKAEYINGLSKLHGVSPGSIINGLLERTPMGELTHIAITLRDAHQKHIQEQTAKLVQTPKQPQGDQP
jgi:hypothetical protein